MRSFGKRLAGALVLLACASSAAAQTTASPAEQPAVRTAAGARYEALQEQELLVSTSAASGPDDFRFVINNYWSFVRRHPSSGYADNALWQAASLSREALRRFNQERDRYRAVQLFQWLRDQYPHSPLRADASAEIEQIQAGPAAAVAPDSTIRAVYREVLPEVVRITVELDKEVPFYQERIDGPSRLFFDLKGTNTVPALVDAMFRYDSDVVRHIRLGRHPNSTTRIVLDLENVARYSVFTLYTPYRIVIDAERAPGARFTPSKDTETAGTIAVAPQKPRPVAGSTATSSKPLSPAARVAPVTPIASSAPVIPRAPVAVPATSTASIPAGSAAPVVPSTPLPPSANKGGSFSVARQLGLGVSKIVIDPGHGGHDPGASSFGATEADLVLDVALRLEKLLKQASVEVILTRRTNDFVSLEERTEMANRESADLFLSIHANASANPAAQGVETYFLNFALNPQAEAVAARENAASEKTMNSLPGILKAITLNNKLNESREFASSIQRALVRGLRPGNKALKDLGVKQAPFMVLIGAAMPSVLAEISFVTNQEEARLLKTPAYRDRIAASLLAGILRYQQSLKKVERVALESKH